MKCTTRKLDLFFISNIAKNQFHGNQTPLIQLLIFEIFKESRIETYDYFKMPYVKNILILQIEIF